MSNYLDNRYNRYIKEGDNKQVISNGYQTEEESLVISYLTLRKFIGLLGIALPIICLCASLFYSSKILPSISHYYHSTVRIFFAGTLFSLATFMWTYKGVDVLERGISRALAVLAFLIVLFPTSNTIGVKKQVYSELELTSFIQPRFVEQPWVGKLHLAFAFVFFILLAILIFFHFIPQELKKRTPSRLDINIYKACGFGMIVSLLSIVVLMAWIDNSESWILPPTFVFEAISLLCFGVSWLTRGESFVKK